ncbi:MAG: tetratricopeptide repeat protein [Thermoplasmata archaeon]|nr:tetratricopeptide repeat protein [Thermoplasmata archaeon]
MNIELKENISEIISNRNSKVLIFYGPEGIGKTHTIKNLLSKKNSTVKYFKYENGEDNYQKLLNLLDISDTAKKYVTLTSAISPSESRKTYELLIYLIMTRIDELKNKENLYFVIDDLENMDKDFLTLFFHVSSKFLKEDVKARMIAIYRKDKINAELENMINILKSMGALEIGLSPYSLKNIEKIFEELNYKIPEKIISIIYERSNGSIKNIFNFIKILEDQNYIIEKTFIKPLTEKTINEISELISEKPEEKILEKLSPDEIIVLIYLSLLNEKIEAMKLMDLVNLNEENFINAVDALVRKKIVKEDGDFLEIRDKNLKIYVEKSFSNLRIRDARIKIAKYLEQKGDLYRSGIQYYYANILEKAYENLSKVGKIFYQAGDFYNAQNALNLATSIKIEDDEINRYLFDILRLQDDYEGILNLSKKILEKDPENVDAILNQADSLFKLSEYEESKIRYDLALKKAKNEKHKAMAKFGLGRYYYYVEKLEESERILYEAIEIAREVGDYNTEEKAFRLLGNIEYDKRNFPKALYYYERSKTICESIGNYYDLASTYNNIGNVSAEINLKEGKFYYLKAKEISEKFWFPSFLQTLSINLAIISEYEGNVKEAVDLFKRALGISIINKSFATALNSILNILDPLVKMGNIEEAEKLVNIGLDLSTKLGKQNEKILMEIFKKLLNKIRGIDDNYIQEIEKIKNSEIKFYIDYANASLAMYYLYSGDINKTIESFEYIKDKIKDPTTEDLLDIIDYIELLGYKKYFENGLDDRFLELAEIVDKIEFMENVKFVKWRNNIIKGIIMIEKKDKSGLEIFKENIKNIDDQDLKFLSSRLKIIFGLYLNKNFNDRTILEEGIKQLKSLNLKGAEKAFEKALSF